MMPSELMNEIFVPFTDALWLNFLINLIFLLVLYRVLIFRNNFDIGFLSSIFILNITIYFTTAVLNKTELNLGAGFGLFAVFSMLRFRTTDISLHQMTFMFLAIAFGLIAGVWQSKLIGLFAIFTLILTLIFCFYAVFRKQVYSTKTIAYDKINLIIPERHQELLSDLKARTGLDVKKVEILDIDFLKDATEIKIFYN
jgi:ribose/xylose/arabinose/galactoside ABC-type transport system permease subunit